MVVGVKKGQKYQTLVYLRFLFLIKEVVDVTVRFVETPDILSFIPKINTIVINDNTP